MFFEQVLDGEGCKSYIVGCKKCCGAVIIDPALGQLDHYIGIVNREGLRVRYIIETHTHADHFSAARKLKTELNAQLVTHRESPAPDVDLHVEDGQMLALGELRLKILYTPGHTKDSMSIFVNDRVFTGDALLIGGTGRTDLPTGDPEQLHDSLFGKLLKLDDDILVYPAHDYKGLGHSTIRQERVNNPRLQKVERAEFVSMMNSLNLSAPTHLTEALRTNISGGKSVQQLLADASDGIAFMSLEELSRRVASRPNDFVVLDVREHAAYQMGHVPGAINIPRGQLELSVNEQFPDPGVEILAVCDYGKISTLAAATLRDLGFTRAIALDGGMQSWRENGQEIEMGDLP